MLGALVLVVLTGCALPSSSPRSTTTTNPTTTTAPPRPPVLADRASSGTELASSSLPGIERDCSLSTRLADGATLWVFCDSVKPGSFLVTSTAAVAPAGAPTQLAEFVSPSGWPALLLSPTPAELAAADAQRSRHPWAYAGVQPTAMTTLSDGRVVVFYNRMLTLDTMQWEQLGSGIGLFDPGGQPLDGSEPLLATREADDLFSMTEPAFGQAAAYDDGYVVTIGCRRQTRPDCYLARVPANALVDRAAWRFFDGSGWTTDLAAARPIGVAGIPNQHAMIGLSRLGSGLWSLSTSPMPGFTNEGQVSFSPSLTGPWTDPHTFVLPSCGTDLATNCYGLEVQPSLSTPAALGVTYFSFASRRSEWATLAVVG